MIPILSASYPSSSPFSWPTTKETLETSLIGSISTDCRSRREYLNLAVLRISASKGLYTCAGGTQQLRQFSSLCASSIVGYIEVILRLFVKELDAEEYKKWLDLHEKKHRNVGIGAAPLETINKKITKIKKNSNWTKYCSNLLAVEFNVVNLNIVKWNYANILFSCFSIVLEHPRFCMTSFSALYMVHDRCACCACDMHSAAFRLQFWRLFGENNSCNGRTAHLVPPGGHRNFPFSGRTCTRPADCLIWPLLRRLPGALQEEIKFVNRQTEWEQTSGESPLTTECS